MKYFRVFMLLMATGFLLLCFMCTGLMNDEDIILEMYAKIMRSYNREDLHGVMVYISKDYRSDIENQRTYDEVKEYRRLFILSNTNVSIDFRNIVINVLEDMATITYDIHMKTNRLRKNWSQTDTLRKSRGKWEVVSSELIEQS